MASPFNFALTPSMPVTPEGMFPDAQAGAAARPGFLQRFQDMRRNNPEALIALGAGMMQGDMGAGFALAGQQMAKYRERMAAEQQKNKTAEYLSRQFGMSPEDALAVAQNPALLSQVLRQRAGGDTRYGLNPIWGTDPETGEPTLGVLGDDGSFKRVDTGGFEISTGIDKIDLGDRIGIRDKRSGQIIGYERKGGAPSADQRPTPDGGVEAIPGSELDRKRRAAEAAETRRRTGEQNKGDLVAEEIDRAIAIMDSGVLPDTGFGAFLSGVPGTDAKNLSAILDTIKANIGFQQLNEMRQSSPTGGALGQVTERELAFLQAVAGSLDQSQSAEQLRYNLNRLWNAFMDVVHGEGNGPARRPLSGAGGNAPAPSNGPIRQDDPLGLRY